VSGARRLSVLTAAALAAAALGLAAGCGREAPMPAESKPLVGFLDSARRVIATRTLDFGTESARESFLTGWGPDEKGGGATFVWGVGDSSSLRFEVVDRRARRLVLRGWSFPFRDDPPQEVTVLLNGRDLGRRLMPLRRTELEFEVHGDELRGGENLLEIRYARHEGDNADLERAVAWDALSLSGGTPPQEPPGRTPAGDLELPAGTALEWTLELPGDSWLSWSRVTGRGGARLEVAAESEGESHERSEEAGVGAGRFRISAAGEPHRLRRFSLRAVSHHGGGSVRIEGARLHSPGIAGGSPERKRPATAVRTGAAGPARTVAQSLHGSRPNVVIYIIDTLRADHLGCYGYPRATSPHIDRFASHSTLFEEGRAQASWTRPAVATILTGLYPITHQAERTIDRLPERIETLAERLAAAGYETAMLTANGNVAGRFGFRQGFDQFVYLPERRSARYTHVRSWEMNRQVFDWLDHRRTDRPFFLVVHTVDPHEPYTPREKYRKVLAADVKDTSIGLHAQVRRLPLLSPEEARRRAPLLEELYDAEIADNDASFGELVARFERMGLGRNTAWFLLADHGEEFYDHGGWTHGSTLYEEQLRIPYVVRMPDGVGAGLVVHTPAEQIDVAPTILDLAGVALPAELPGRSLIGEIARREGTDGGPSFAFLDHDEHRVETVVDAQWKLLLIDRSAVVPTRSPVKLFALGSDPDELEDLAFTRPLRRLWLRGELGAAEARYRASLPPVRARVDRALAARLRALGYLR
jgi:arylsulfatase A-like enzyme